MRIYADFRCLQDPNYAFRGVGLHTSAVLRNARRVLDEPVEIVGVLDENLPALPDGYRALADSVQYSRSPRLLNGETALFFQGSPMTHEQALLAPLLGRSHVLSCTIIYDFIPLDEPRYLPTPSARWSYYANLLWLKYYNLFFPISEYSSRRLHEVLGPPEDCVEVTGASLRADFCRFDSKAVDLKQLRCRFHPRSYFLVVGGQDPRKNVEGALVAHCRMLTRTQRNSGLVIVGHYTDAWREQLRQLFRQHGGPDNLLEFVDGVSDADLAALYHYAIATICPSRLEGFSLPVVEALASGSPVLAANCEAQAELVPQPEALFPPDDTARLADLMADLMGRPEQRDWLLGQQQPVVPRFAEEAVAQRFWTRAQDAYRHWQALRRPAVRGTKPRLAFLTPYPPDRSGVAEYTAHSLTELARHATLDVFTNAQRPTTVPFVRRFEPISEMPYVSNEYERVVAVVGNSHFHPQIVGYHCRYGGVCVAHDNRLADMYRAWRGLEWLAQKATQWLGRPVSVKEAEAWNRNPHKLPSIFFDEILVKADPLVVHSRGIQARVAKQYGKDIAYLPFCCYRQFSDEELSDPSRQEARRRLGLPADRLVIITLGIVDHVKGMFECLWALENLRAWGIPADLYFVGASDFHREALQQVTERLKLDRHVHRTGDWVSDEDYHDFLLAADFAIQLRTHCFGGLSGAVLDCISAGLPTVANEDLANAMEAPEFVRRVPDHLSPPLIAEQLADAYDAGLHRSRCSPAREEYVRIHSFENYAARMMQVLELA